VPVAGNFPDFFTPPLVETDVEAHWDAILSLPKQAMRDDLCRTFRRYPAPPWAYRLYEDGRLGEVVGVLRDYHELVVEPSWREMYQQVETDRARYARRLLAGGVEGLLQGLHSSIRWRNPVLEADYPVDLTVDLAGRGLVLVPAHFCWGAPVTFIDGDQPPMLVCPSGDEVRGSIGPGSIDDGIDRLGSLLGATRARLLTELTTSGTTTELARRLDISQAAISQHTRVLREAGLVTTCRFGSAVRHALTPLGHNLLRG
jgi:DNA-binding transcriptional ArsR family regulator